MRKFLIALAVLAAPALAEDKPAAAPSPSEIVAAAPKGDWVAIAESDLLVMDLAPDAKGRPRRVVIQLMPYPVSQDHVYNIRQLAGWHWWDGTSINRVQDNYVVQWGDATEKKSLPDRLKTISETAYLTDLSQYFMSSDETGMDTGGETPGIRPDTPLRPRDSYQTVTAFWRGWPVGVDADEFPVLIVPKRNSKERAEWERMNASHGMLKRGGKGWPVHCYGMVGVGRDMPPDTGSGAELYAVIGHAPRHLDRNIALVGRVIEGIEHLSSLPRGTGALGFYEKAEERTVIQSIRLASDLPSDKPFPSYEHLSTESASFAAYAEARANRRDAFFIRPAGGADVCNIPVPVRRSTGSR